MLSSHTRAPGQVDSTIQLSREDLITIPPSPEASKQDSTIQLSQADLLSMEPPATPAEVVVRPADLRPGLMVRGLGALDRAARQAAARASESARAGWAWSRRTAAATARGMGPLLRGIARGCHQLLSRCGVLLALLWGTLRKGGQAISDRSFHARDWAGLKLQRHRRGGSGPLPRLREAGVDDRALIEDLQRALAAYCAGEPARLMVAEVEGRVAILVPTSDEAGKPERASEPTALGRPALTSTR